MLQLVMLLVRCQSVEKAMKKLGIKEEERSVLVDHFTEIGISPIPLWTSFCAQRLPGPVELLRAVSKGEVEVEYLKIKYK